MLEKRFITVMLMSPPVLAARDIVETPFCIKSSPVAVPLCLRPRSSSNFRGIRIHRSDVVPLSPPCHDSRLDTARNEMADRIVERTRATNADYVIT